MIFDVTKTKHPKIQKMYNQIVKELNKWYGIGWTENTPNLFIIEDKEVFHQLAGEASSFLSGFGDYCNNIFVYSPRAANKYTEHNYYKENYRKFLKHELDHKFFDACIGGSKVPQWLREGNAYYVSDQFKDIEGISQFECFLDSEGDLSKRQYIEAAVAVKLLVDKVGEQDYLKFLKGLSNKDFEMEFSRVFDMGLEYEEFNEMI
jgi:hypothetical protein